MTTMCSIMWLQVYDHQYKAVVDGVETDSMMEIDPGRRIEIFRMGNGSNEVLEVHDFKNVSPTTGRWHCPSRRKLHTRTHPPSHPDGCCCRLRSCRWRFAAPHLGGPVIYTQSASITSGTQVCICKLGHLPSNPPARQTLRVKGHAPSRS